MAYQIAPKKRESKITIPERAHPLARALYAELKRQNVTLLELEHRSGVLVGTVKSYRKNNRPSLETMEACLGALGWHVLPVPKSSILPEGLRADLEAVAAKHCMSLPCLEYMSAFVGFGKTVPAQPRRAT